MMKTTRNRSQDHRYAQCLIVPRTQGETLKRLLDELGVRDLTLRIRSENENLLFPLKPEGDLKVLRKTLGKPRLRIVERKFEIYSHASKKNLSSLLEELGLDKTEHFPRSYDTIGDIAVIELSRELADKSSQIGQALLGLHKRLKSVYAKSGPVTGIYRLRELKLIAGEPKTETIHRENGCLFKVNIATAFFNPRLGTERRRVAGQVSGGERVLDMFAGVGTFSILIAKLAKARTYAVEINPEAVKYLRENVQLNNVGNYVEVFEGDASHLSSEIKGKMDRVIMNLPEKSAGFVESACRALKAHGGILHFYSFQTEPKPVTKAEKLLSDAVKASTHEVREITYGRSIREISARTYQVVIDARIS